MKIKNFNEIFEILDSYFNSNLDKKIIIWLSWWRSFLWFYEYFLKYLEKLNPNILKNIYFWLVDERIVDFDDKERNFTQIYDVFFKKLIDLKIISQNQLIKIDFSNPNYLDALNKDIKKFDIAFFGSWEDWHIASLFPNNDILKNNLDQFIIINNSPKSPKNRVTISKKMISWIDLSFLFFVWKEKKDAYLKFLDKDIWSYDLPAKLLLDSKKIYIYNDFWE